MKKLVVLSGAGMSAESGLRTFREMGGLWEEYDVYEVASPGGWQKDRALVLRFYNERRKQLQETEPNNGHLGLVELEQDFEVWIVTQNVDDLHERAGSSRILHLHGELKKSRSTVDPDLVYDIEGWELGEGDLCEKGSQLRPHVVWFGEAVPAIEEAARIVSTADIFVIIGTSMNVYPAAGLINYVPDKAPIYVIDPNEVAIAGHPRIRVIQKGAGEGVQELREELRNA
ncbi:MAG: Sir2 family NAD-dependent protein deacetylase [Bacteroidota bacterium]|nr:Sir2 family NAD-dependent protein deacetylase [Bacteroidota bacterium]